MTNSYRNRVFSCFFFAVLLCFPVKGIPLFADILFSESAWDFGMIPADVPVFKTFSIENTGDVPVSVSLISSCECLFADPESLELFPQTTAGITLKFDPAGYAGSFRNFIVIRTDSADMRKALFEVRGTIAGDNGSLEAEHNETAGQDNAAVFMDYYYSQGCRTCNEFLKKKLPDLEKKLGISIRVVEKDIFDPEVFEELTERLSAMRVNLNAFPVLITEQTVLQGEGEIKDSIETVLLTIRRGMEMAKVPASGSSSRALAVVPVILAGLLDGINPCAFTTIIFLLSMLAAAGRGRREILIIGACFALAVFIAYYLIGIGLFKALRAAAIFPVVGAVIRWVLVAVLAAFAALSVVDYIKIRKGKSSEILLQLPKYFKQRIHAAVRVRVRSATLIGSAFVLGFLVSVFELACTGQVYFPAIAYMVQSGAGSAGFGLLFIYNVGFILPLSVVFLLAYAGVGSEKLASVFRKRLGLVKLGTAVLFAGLAVMTIVL